MGHRQLADDFELAFGLFEAPLHDRLVGNAADGLFTKVHVPQIDGSVCDGRRRANFSFIIQSGVLSGQMGVNAGYYGYIMVEQSNTEK